jgi:arylsulfatase A-like enzyme
MRKLIVNKRPNILVLLTDQQRYDTIAALQSGETPHLLTPNLDRLVRRGRAYRRAYSSTPVCMAARHDLLTAVSARHHGYWFNHNRPMLDAGLPTVPRSLTHAGYQTIAVGKMHYHPPCEHHGWSHMHLMEELPHAVEDDAYLQHLQEAGYGHVRNIHGVRPLFYQSPQAALVPQTHHGSAWVAQKTVEILKTPRNRPLFLMSGWIAPHPPHYVPQAWLEKFRDVKLPDTVPVPSCSSSVYAVSPDTPEIDDLRVRRHREAYFASIAFVDQSIGRVLDELDALNMTENTLVIFTSDHGEMLGDHGLFQKFCPYESSARIPLILAGPGIEPESVCDDPVTLWDVSATLLEAAAVALPRHAVGMGLLDAKACADRQTVCIHHGGRTDEDAPRIGRVRYVAAVSRTHKFIHYFDGGNEELFDLVADAGEQHNLLHKLTAQVQAIAQPLREACLAFELVHGQSQRVTEGRFADSESLPCVTEGGGFYSTSVAQYPRWMQGITASSLQDIVIEMQLCAAAQGASVCGNAQWQTAVKTYWQNMGGDPHAMQSIIDQVQSREVTRETTQYKV